MMAALVGYGSSDEDEEDVQKDLSSVQEIDSASILKVSGGSQPHNAPTSEGKNNAAASTEVASSAQESPEQRDALPDGPSLGPSRPSAIYPSDGYPSGRSASPHTAYREEVQNLTLPTVADFSIPESPPGSPPPGADAKIAQFLKLKQQGVHFNEKLAASSALKNPSLLGRLIENTGLAENRQYETTLDRDLWDPHALPGWAFKEELERARTAAEKMGERGRMSRSGVDFVRESEPAPKRKSRFDQ